MSPNETLVIKKEKKGRILTASLSLAPCVDLHILSLYLYGFHLGSPVSFHKHAGRRMGDYKLQLGVS